ncbi:MAG: hypothetical protein WCG83_00020 [Candidatus Peregrinibacteria bacterium]
MKKLLLISPFLLLAFSILCATSIAVASTTDGTINAVNRYAWSENIGWIDFGASQGAVHVTDSALTGYAWNETTGWISLNCSNDTSCATVDYTVTNTSAGVLGGNAWGENVGWIQFAPTNGGVTIDASGNFSGYAWGENVGWIVFNCSNQTSCAAVDYKVATDWIPLSARPVAASSSSASVGPTPTGGGKREGWKPPQLVPDTRLLTQHAPTIPSVSNPVSLHLAPTNLPPIFNALRERLVKRIERIMVTQPQRKASLEKSLLRLDARLAKRK